MRPTLILLGLGLTAPAGAQQALYASTCTGELVEILNYAAAPTCQVIPFTMYFSAQDIAARPGTGTIFVLDQLFGIPNVHEVDPQTGQVISTGSCFSWPSFSYSLEVDQNGVLIGEDWMGTGNLLSASALPGCFTSFGPSTGVANNGDVAMRNDGTLLTMRGATTEIESVDPQTGTATVVADLGLAFRGLEVDTDGTIYGLTSDGGFYRVALAPPSATLLTMLPPTTATGCFQDGWSGLAFRLPAMPIDVQTVCPGAPNSAGPGAHLAALNPTGPGAGWMTLSATGMPPLRAALLLTASGPGTSTVGAGTLCLGSGLMRVFPPTVASPSGDARFRLDLSAVPGHGLVMAGDTLYFQVLYRDQYPSPTVNLTDALRIRFN